MTRSSNKQFWPILGRCPKLSMHPFPIGIYYGLKKPENSSVFLKSFVDEMKEIQHKGITFQHCLYFLKINAIICDAPAQSFVKNIVTHNAYHGCGKCTQSGEWLNDRMSFPEISFTKRTDESFKLRIDEFHHKDNSILEELGVGMVTQFPADYLHLLCLGVPRKLALFWEKGPLKTRLPGFKQTELTVNLLNAALTQPAEFQRRIRGFDQLHHWKGTEFRRFLFYDSAVVLKNVLNSEEYKNFISLHIAVRICNDETLHEHLDIARKLFKYFVESFSDIYGECYISYNPHNLLHVVDDVELFGTLDKYSAYPFESAYGKMKKKVRNGYKMLEQAANRIVEDMEHSTKTKKEMFPILRKPKLNVLTQEMHYLSVEFESFILKKDEKNCYFMNFLNNVYQFEFAKKVHDQIVLFGKMLMNPGSLYETPLNSKLLNIFLFKENAIESETTEVPLISVKCKVFAIKYDKMMATFPMHSC